MGSTMATAPDAPHRQVAQELGAVPSAFTFDPHPQTVILGRPMPLLTSPEDRADLMRKYYGIQDVIVEPFTVPRMKQPGRTLWPAPW